MFAIYFFNALVYKEYLEIDMEKITYQINWKKTAHRTVNTNDVKHI